ncbi:unnamed protein product [Polarella glacialis]|uniref:Uncharacterized protein n=1 Tax=Polarella glacialis TaxID=89957 RepID=A0A813E8V0_POLGL|nr:unnamed protein product [Polarella glacialis]
MCSLPTGLRARIEDPDGLWPQAFERWLLQKGEEYPSRYFSERIVEFLGISGAFHKDFLFQNGQIRAVRLGFELIEEPTGWLRDQKEIRAVKQAWDDHLAARNAGGGYKSSNAWHTSPVWEALAARQGLFTNVQWSLVIMAILGPCLTLRALGSLRLTAAVLVSMVSTVLVQCMVLTGWFRWKVAAMEALGLVIYTGFMLHLHLLVAVGYAAVPSPSPPAGDSAASGTEALCRQGSVDLPQDDPELLVVEEDVPRADSGLICDRRSLPPLVASAPEGLASGSPSRSLPGASPRIDMDEAALDRRRRVLHALGFSAWPVAYCAALGVLIGILMMMPVGLVETRSSMGAALISASIAAAFHALALLPSLLLIMGPTPFDLKWWRRFTTLSHPMEQRELSPLGNKEHQIKDEPKEEDTAESLPKPQGRAPTRQPPGAASSSAAALQQPQPQPQQQQQEQQEQQQQKQQQQQRQQQHQQQQQYGGLLLVPSGADLVLGGRHRSASASSASLPPASAVDPASVEPEASQG